MAIGTTPLFSKISGSVGPVDYRTRRNGKIEIGKKRIPANPQSTEQQNTRNAYGRLHELWQNAAWIDKTQYENIAAAYDISPWNAFLMRHLTTMRLNPVAYWPFVEGTGNTLHDFTTNENHCTIYGASWNLFGPFDIPQLFFDGSDDYVQSNINIDMSAPHTIAICAKPDSFKTQFLMGRLVDVHYYLQFTDAGIIHYASGSALNWNTATHYNLTRQHFIIAFDGSDKFLHINGTNKGHITQSTTNGHTLQFGKYGGYEASKFEGNMNRYCIFTKSLSPSEYLNIYNSEKSFY